MTFTEFLFALFIFALILIIRDENRLKFEALERVAELEQRLEETTQSCLGEDIFGTPSLGEPNGSFSITRCTCGI